MRTLAIVLILIATQIAYGQNLGIPSGAPLYDPNNPPPEWVTRMNENRKALDELNGKNEQGMIAGRSIAAHRRAKKTYTKEDLEKIKAANAPWPEDLKVYKDFLAQPHNGIFRIFPDLGCADKFVVDVSGDCENVFFAPSSFGFTKYNFLDKDIRFIPGLLVSDNFFSQGIMTRLGDVPLDKVELSSEGMKFLNDPAPTNMAGAREFYARIAGGVNKDGHRYATRVAPENNVTYALRLISYRIGNDVPMRLADDARHRTPDELKWRFLAVQNDDRMDVTIAFRVVRTDEDGSLIILFRELRRQEAPKLTFKKGDKYLDLKERLAEPKATPAKREGVKP